MSRNNVDQLESVLDQTASIISKVQPGQLSLPTPCPDYNVETLIKHMISWLNKFALESTGSVGSVDPRAYKFEGSYSDDFRKNTDIFITNLRKKLPSEPPVIGMNMIEYIVHGWDLAVATGQMPAYGHDEATEALKAAHSMMKPEYRSEGQVFGLEVRPPEGASETDKLVAFMGRNPAWTKKK